MDFLFSVKSSYETDGRTDNGLQHEMETTTGVLQSLHNKAQRSRQHKKESEKMCKGVYV